MVKKVNFGPAFSKAFTLFGKKPWLIIGSSLLMGLMVIAGGGIPFLNFLFIILVQFPLLGGFLIFLLKYAKEEDPTVNDLFAGFKDYGKWMGLGWLMVAIVFAAYLPALIGGAIGYGLPGSTLRTHFRDLEKSLETQATLIPSAKAEESTNASEVLKFYAIPRDYEPVPQVNDEAIAGFYLKKSGGELSEEEIPANKVLEKSTLLLTGKDLKKNARVFIVGETTAVLLELNPQATQKWAEWTRKHIHEYVAIVLEKKIISCPIIQAEIPNGQVEISGGFNGPDGARKAQSLVSRLNTGALPEEHGGWQDENNEPTGEQIQMPIAGEIIFAIGALISVIAIIYLILRFNFAWFIAAEGAGAIEALKRSAEMTSGIRLSLFGYSIVLALFVYAGLLACGIGIIVTAIIAGLVRVLIYLDVKSQMAESAVEPVSENAS